MSARKKASLLDRRKVVAQILASRGDALVVTGLGAPTWDAAAAGDCALNFYTWGGMGCAAMVGLGLAAWAAGQAQRGARRLGWVGVVAGAVSVLVLVSTAWSPAGAAAGHDAGAGAPVAKH